MARLAGAWVIAIDLNEARLELAQTLGADAIVDARQGPFHEAVRRLTDGQGVDVVLEFVANQETLPSSYQSLKRAARLVFVGYTPQLPLSVMPHELGRNEWEVLGSRANTKQELQETMDLVAQAVSSPSWIGSFPSQRSRRPSKPCVRAAPWGAMCWPCDSLCGRTPAVMVMSLCGLNGADS